MSDRLKDSEKDIMKHQQSPTQTKCVVITVPRIPRQPSWGPQEWDNAACDSPPALVKNTFLQTSLPFFIFMYFAAYPEPTIVLPTDPPSPWPPLSPCSRIRFKRMVLDGLNGTAPAYLQALVKSHTPALRSTTCPLMPGSAKSNQSSNNKILTLLYFHTAMEESAPCRRQDRRDSHQPPEEAQDSLVQSSAAAPSPLPAAPWGWPAGREPFLQRITGGTAPLVSSPPIAGFSWTLVHVNHYRSFRLHVVELPTLHVHKS